jgi:tetratricopeptide (TPR) repeat protein
MKMKKKFYRSEDAVDFVREQPERFTNIPEEFRTREVCLLAVKYFGGVCGHIPEQIQSEDFFIEAVTINENGKALKYVPVKYLTRKVCDAALQSHPAGLSADELHDIAGKLYNAGEYDTMIFMLDKAEELEPEIDCSRDYRGKSYLEKQDFTAAVEHFKKRVEFDPYNNMRYLAEAEAKLVCDEEAALKFIQEYPYYFTKLPEKFRTREVCLLAVKRYGDACQYIPKKLRTEDFFIEAVKLNEDGKALKYIYADYLTEKVCDAALHSLPAGLSVAELRDVMLALWEKGDALYSKDEYDKAIFVLNKALEAYPKSLLCLNSRGSCYSAKGDFAAAVADFKKALELEPDNSHAKLNLADAEAKLTRPAPPAGGRLKE